MKSCDPEEAIKLCNEILDLLEDLPEEADDFKESVETKVMGIHDWIDAKNCATEAQMRALENMMAGVTKWIR